MAPITPDGQLPPGADYTINLTPTTTPTGETPPTPVEFADEYGIATQAEPALDPNANADQPQVAPGNPDLADAFDLGAYLSEFLDVGNLQEQADTDRTETTDGDFEDEESPLVWKPSYSALKTGPGGPGGLGGLGGAGGTGGTGVTEETGETGGTGNVSALKTGPGGPSGVGGLGGIDRTGEVTAEELAEANMSALQSSTDPDEVFESLLNLTGLDVDPTLTPDQKAVMRQALVNLSRTIALRNETGPPLTALKSWDPAVVTAELNKLLVQANPNIGAEELHIFESQLLRHAGDSIAALNAYSGEAPPIDPTFVTLNTSTDPEEVYAALTKDIDVSTLSQEALDGLRAVAEAIAQANAKGEGVPGIESVNPETVFNALDKLLKATLSDATKAEIQATLRSISEKLATINEAKWNQDLYSTDPVTIEKALIKLTNLEYDTTLTPDERASACDYLKILSQVLALMSQIRTKIAQMDALLTKLESEGKLSNIKDQTRIASETYENSMKEIKHALEKMKEAKEKAMVLKIVMPIVSALLMVVAVALILVSIPLFKVSWVTIPVAISLIVFAVSIGSATIVVQSTNAVDKMCDAAGIQNPILRALMGLAVQAVIILLAIVLTAGVLVVVLPFALPAMGLQVGQTGAQTAAQAAVQIAVQLAMQSARTAAQTASEVARQMAMEIIKQLILNPALWMALAGSIGSAVFSSGIITAVLSEGFKAAGLSDKEAEIAAMVITIIAMIIMLLALLAMAGAAGAVGGGAASSAGTGAGKAVASSADDVGAGLDDVAKVGASAGDDMASTGVGTGDDAAKAGASTPGAATATTGGTGGLPPNVAQPTTNIVMRMLQSLARRAEEMLKDPFLYLNLLSGLAQMAEPSVQIGYGVQQIQRTQSQKEITKEIAQGKAILELLGHELPGFDANIEALQEDARNFMEYMSSLMSLFAGMVDSASQFTTDLHQTA